MSVLDRIEKANDIKNIDASLLPLLSDEIRAFLIGNISRTGGHLASNLGAVELTIALHLCMSFPEDKLIFDVGHQSYTHKLLTGRKDDFYKLRQFGGMSGFPKRQESPCDAFDTGHSSTSLSAALGLVRARELRGTSEKVCAVIGDGSMTGGMVYEALDQMSQLKSNCVIILNDNEMSISKNVGGLSKSLNQLRVGESYNELKSNVENALLNIPSVGYKMAKGIKRSKDSIRNLLVPGSMFEEMGITYVGPVDGHNISEMVKIFQDAFRLNKPVIVHVKTVKGKGYMMAERYPEHFHGVGPFDIETGKSLKKKSKTYTDVFAKKLIELGERNDHLIAITAAMGGGTGVRQFQRRFPDRTFDVGIAEQHAVTFAAGLAAGGYIPVVAIYSSFLQRAYDQMLHDVCLQGLHVIFAIDRSGIVGEDGETHQGIYDTAYLRSMPGIQVIAPRDERELGEALQYAVNECDGPVAIKYPRGACYCDCDSKSVRFIEGRADVVNFDRIVGSYSGRSLAIISVGDMFETAKMVRDRIREATGFTPELINLRFIKPLDEERIKETAETHDIIACLEDTAQSGSAGEAIASLISRAGITCQVENFSVHDEILCHGSVARLRELEGIDGETIFRRLYEMIIAPYGTKR